MEFILKSDFLICYFPNIEIKIKFYEQFEKRD